MRKLVLWGHHADEYQEMFALAKDNFQGSILEYCCGPSAVNAELSQKGTRVVSVDPLFNLDKDTLFSKVELIFHDMERRVLKEQDKFDFSLYGTPDALIEKRRGGMGQFFADYEKGKQEKRYLPINSLSLPFDNFSFDFALSSHYLFADLDDQDVDYHLEVIQELARVAKEVRIFPLIDRYHQPSPFLGPVLLGLQEKNFGVEVKEVSYHLQPSGNAMLRVWARECVL
ncbi:hypothetical protein [Legionella jordanis]|uniref:SAM-dependent methyltransferase n=1 Tax=Legionella jordanis TaxID=456 RepID=A0A0W0V999_9GAMM|nr:hypothetical protein [Legionella jordanis]KTD16664.1 hypothetical protein Ljor_0970 [Legionella jordanis]RMX03802.1 hypothetical protein EAW55_05435 [Legionella jordanis]RMX22137.1 hypothetical protein EAS68_00990 [Legionella jordanis]VEH11868.1 SAM-dependent methyltransferase [Legionella jordanis]HAT8712824.1 hypothetical protein [Legionella jordanis]